MLDTTRFMNRHAVWLAIALAGVVLQGCEHKPAPVVQHAPLYAADLAGAAKQCTAPAPALAPGKEVATTMQVGNDGGWCGISVALDGKPYSAGLLTTLPQHGKVFIHPVSDDTRIDYTPDRMFRGNDSFVVKLLPGEPVMRVNVTVTP